MKRIYQNAGVARRANMSLVIFSGIFAYGLLDLWMAVTMGSISNAIFGILFILGAFYGAYTALGEARDTVLSIDADETGAAVLTVWAPFVPRKVETRLERLTGWRHWVYLVGARKKRHFLFVREESIPRLLRLELVPGKPLTHELRNVALEAFQDYERESGQHPV